MIKLLVLYLVRGFLSVFTLFPMKKNSVFFLSYQGEQYSCNPRAIFEYLQSYSSGMTCIWGLYDCKKIPNHSSANNIQCVKPNTVSYFKKLITSKYVVTNIQLPTYIPKKKNSIWINTWHGGGAFKKVEYLSTSLYAKVTKQIQTKQTDCYISSSKKFTQVMSDSTGIPRRKFLEIGMPRNDVFFASAEEKDTIRKKVLRFYTISDAAFIVLFAPTYRGKSAVNACTFDFQLDADKVKAAFSKRFGKDVVLIVRAHHVIKEKLGKMHTILDGTSYPDMQDLLVCCDALITDYSSCIWDFALTDKPGFLFVPDLAEYENNRGLYTPISEWAFDYAETNDRLRYLIENYDERKAKEKARTYLASLGNCDTGTATKTIADILKGKKQIYGDIS